MRRASLYYPLWTKFLGIPSYIPCYISLVYIYRRVVELTYSRSRTRPLIYRRRWRLLPTINRNNLIKPEASISISFFHLACVSLFHIIEICYLFWDSKRKLKEMVNWKICVAIWRPYSTTNEGEWALQRTMKPAGLQDCVCQSWP